MSEESIQDWLGNLGVPQKVVDEIANLTDEMDGLLVASQWMTDWRVQVAFMATQLMYYSNRLVELCKEDYA